MTPLADVNPALQNHFSVEQRRIGSDFAGPVFCCGSLLRQMKGMRIPADLEVKRSDGKNLILGGPVATINERF